MMTGMLNALAAMMGVEVEEATGVVVLDGEAMPGSLAPWHACRRAQAARCC